MYIRKGVESHGQQGHRVEVTNGEVVENLTQGLMKRWAVNLWKETLRQAEEAGLLWA